jgi:hypothetical protein
LERVTNQSFEDFPPATLYIDDVVQVIDLFLQACERLEIKSGEYKITDKSELNELVTKFPSGRFPGIQIQGYEPYVSVDFRPYGIRVYISEDTLVQRGIVAGIREIVARGKKRRADFAFNLLFYVGIAAGTWQLMSKDYVLGGFLIGLSFLAIPLAIRSTMRNNVVVYNKTRGEIKSFFERKKDDMVLAIISAAVGALITYLLTKYAM